MHALKPSQVMLLAPLESAAKAAAGHVAFLESRTLPAARAALENAERALADATRLILADEGVAASAGEPVKVVCNATTKAPREVWVGAAEISSRTAQAEAVAVAEAARAEAAKAAAEEAAKAAPAEPEAGPKGKPNK